MKHTKGKWTVKRQIGTSIVVDDKNIAGIHSHDTPIKHNGHTVAYDESETQANANLIASAPDMLKTLEWVRDWMYDHTTQNDTIKKVCDMIDKAEGN